MRNDGLPNPRLDPSATASTPALRIFTGFTLIELILVMAILAIVAAMIVPSLRTFGIGRQTDNAATAVISLANYARTQSVSEGQTYRLNFDPQAETIWLSVQSGGVFVPAKGDYGTKYSMPDGVTMDVDVTPQPTTLLIVPTDVQQTPVQTVPPFGQPLAQANNLIQNQHDTGTPYVEYQPSGRTDPVHIKLTDKLGKVIDLGIQSETETLHVLTAGEMQ